MAPSLPPGVLDVAIERLLGRTSEVARTLSAQASRATTHGRERALLRLLGVEGLDRDGRPLAAAAVDRYLAGHPERLADGVALPFALAALEYDIPAQQLALDVASGVIDLGMEAELLADPARRAAAESSLAALERAALARIDANRTARRELLGVLSEAPGPWLGTTLLEPTAGDAASEARAQVAGGADLVRVEVPVGGELATRLGDIGREVARWSAPAGVASGLGPAVDRDVAPAGSQRGIALLREALDRAAAERGAYVRLSTAPTALAGPEGAAVAASERVDVLELDPIAEIVGVGIHPARALADLAFSARLVARAGGAIHLGAGPVVVGPDMAAGVPSDAATRAGRGLALQLVVTAMALEAGLPPDHVLVGAIPAWLVGEPDCVARAVAEVALRLALLPAHPLALSEPGGADASGRWPTLAAAVLPARRPGLILRRIGGLGFAAAAAASRSAIEVADELAGVTTPGLLSGLAVEHARGCVAAALKVADALGSDGWGAVLGEGPGTGPMLGADSVAPRGAAARESALP